MEVDPEKLHGEPPVGAYRLAARTLIEAEELGRLPEETAEEFDVPANKVRSILACYHSHQPELTRSR